MIILKMFSAASNTLRTACSRLGVRVQRLVASFEALKRLLIAAGTHAGDGGGACHLELLIDHKVDAPTVIHRVANLLLGENAADLGDKGGNVSRNLA